MLFYNEISITGAGTVGTPIPAASAEKDVPEYPADKLTPPPEGMTGLPSFSPDGQTLP